MGSWVPCTTEGFFQDISPHVHYTRGNDKTDINMQFYNIFYLCDIAQNFLSIKKRNLSIYTILPN